MSLEFWFTSLVVVVLLPGTGVICTLAIVPHIAASSVGLAALPPASAALFAVVTCAGVASLLCMAISVLRKGGALSVGQERRRIAAVALVRTGIPRNILNPRPSFSFLAFLPPFMPAGAAQRALATLARAASLVALTFVVPVARGAFAARARACLIAEPAIVRWLKRGLAGGFATVGLRPALAGR